VCSKHPTEGSTHCMFTCSSVRLSE
jgi:hypothetical protein